MEVNVIELLQIIERQAKEIEQLKTRIKELEDLLSKGNKNSKNSSIPPSKNNFGERYRNEKKKEEKKVSEEKKKPKRNNLEISENPTEKVYHSPEVCEHCGKSLLEEPESKINEKYRQELELKILKIIKNHHIVEKSCPYCNHKTEGKYPEEIKSTVQYGTTVKTLSSYLSNRQMIPLNRVEKTFKELFELNVSQGTIIRFNDELARKSELEIKRIKDKIQKSSKIFADESGIYVKNKRMWVYVHSTELLSYFACQENRSFEALEKIGILKDYKGSLITDFYAIYRKYKEIRNFFCNAHLLRELTFVSDIEKRSWSKKMIEILLKLKKIKEEKPLYYKIERYYLNKRYDSIIKNGLKEELSFKNSDEKKSQSQKLLERLTKYKDGYLGFAYYDNIPFTNNQAERDIRPIKVQQKISGTFRTQKGADNYLGIMSIISTLNKQKMPVLESLRKIFDNQTLIFNSI